MMKSLGTRRQPSWLHGNRGGIDDWRLINSEALPNLDRSADAGTEIGETATERQRAVWRCQHRVNADRGGYIRGSSARSRPGGLIPRNLWLVSSVQGDNRSCARNAGGVQSKLRHNSPAVVSRMPGMSRRAVNLAAYLRCRATRSGGANPPRKLKNSKNERTRSQARCGKLIDHLLRWRNGSSGRSLPTAEAERQDSGTRICACLVPEATSIAVCGSREAALVWMRTSRDSLAAQLLMAVVDSPNLITRAMWRRSPHRYGRDCQIQAGKHQPLSDVVHRRYKLEAPVAQTASAS